MGLADRRLMREQSVEARLADDLMPELERVLGGIERTGRAEMQAQGVDEENISVVRKLHIRYDGTDTALLVDYGGT